jgi:hypothetical protein
MMKLDVLPGGDVPLLQWRVPLSDVPQDSQGLCGEDSTGYLDPDHLHVGLPLTVNPLPETEGSEHCVILLPSLEAGRLDLEPLNFVFHERDNPGRFLGQLDAFLVYLFLSDISLTSHWVPLLNVGRLIGKIKRPLRWHSH